MQILFVYVSLYLFEFDIHDILSGFPILCKCFMQVTVILMYYINV